MSEKGKNDAAWEELFEELSILDEIEKQGRFFITADQIRKYREPRLMAKFDHQSHLPKLFQKHSLTILPVSRREYVIGHFDAYEKQEPISSPIKQYRLPSYLESVNPSDIPSEEAALNCAFCSGILADFLGEEPIFPTVSGRRGSPKFFFRIRDKKTGQYTGIEVERSQIEVDAAYEGMHSLALIEAKREISDDFLVRQLYYPYRMWQEKLIKPVKPVFMVYSNDIFSFYQYRFEEPEIYNSLILVNSARYTLENTKISRKDLEQVQKQTKIQPETGIFPQADSFPRVINLCEMVRDEALSRKEITAEYAFATRQTDYYSSAGIYLGLLEKKGKRGKERLFLTETGRQILALPYRERQLAFCRRILSHEIFHQGMAFYWRQGELPDRKTVVSMMKASSLSNKMGESTMFRRAGTVTGWLSWICSLFSG